MSSKRLHIVLIAALVLLFIGLLGGTYGINKLLVSESNNLVALKAKNQALDQEQTSLNKAKSDIKRYDTLNQIAQAVVPQDKNQAEAVREIVNIAAANGVTLSAINFPASTLGNLPSGAASAAAGTAGATPAAAPATAGSASTASTKTANLSQLTPLKNIPGVYQLPITINNDSSHPVPYANFINFLSDLEHNRRTSQVQTITIKPSSDNRGSIIFSLTLSEYIKP
jgi:hypothetical protein